MSNKLEQEALCAAHALAFPLGSNECVDLRAADAGPEALDFLAAFVVGHPRTESGEVWIPCERERHFNERFSPSRRVSQCGMLMLEEGIGLMEPDFNPVTGEKIFTATFKGVSISSEDVKLSILKAFVISKFGDGLVAVPNSLDFQDE